MIVAAFLSFQIYRRYSFYTTCLTTEGALSNEYTMLFSALRGTEYRVEYRFVVDGKRYHGTALLDWRPRQHRIPVFYRPNDPSDHSLDRRKVPDWLVFALLPVLALIALIIGRTLVPVTDPVHPDGMDSAGFSWVDHPHVLAGIFAFIGLVLLAIVWVFLSKTWWYWRPIWRTLVG